ncbi:integrase, catalytic region, zinc finger, CCHC-type containing protein [Tanacetum coccineum]|uniref:Integrase, catalytic region, zinc finger, CCHC-type containing protein n=1 Tax=Tanacetum coccineum TaxID=301880 RepID=A0ABQ5A302_9ASTR
MTRQRDKLINFVSKCIGTVRFGNDHFAAIMGYGDLHIQNILITRVYYVEGLGHNLFSFRQFCDSDLEVAFKKHMCFVRNLDGVDLLSGSRGSNLYTISLNDMMKSSPICLLSKASKTKSWLWHRRLSHLNFGIINQLAKESLVKDRKPYLKHLYVFGALCYPLNDSEDLGKLKPKADIGIFIGYSPSKKAYQIYNKITRLIMETIHLQFDKLTQMASEQHGSGPEFQGLTSGYISSGLVQNQATLTSAKPPIKNEWDLLFQPMFDEYFKPPSVVSTTISAATLLPPDTTGASSSTSIDQDAPSPKLNEEEDVEFNSDTFTNSFAPLVPSLAESSSRIVDTSNMHTFQKPHTNTRRWTKDHPLVIIIGNPSKPVSTRCQLATNALWCYFHAFLTKVELKNYKDAMKESC